MTVERSCTVEPEDLISVVFECKECGSQTILKLRRIQQKPTSCVNCGSQWLAPGTSEHQLIGRLLDDLGALETALKNRQFSLKFQLRSSEEPVDQS
jgi:predicted RNA-binding Zn-ribbon protein involved in translation (DUF1610 family)